MSIATLLIVARMLVSVVCVGLLVACEDYTCRLWLGGGILSAVVPTVIYTSTRVNRKIGFDSGYIRAEADMLRAHCELQDD